jgi:cell division protein ZapA (FtsZ GTPase activity inhibitor)
MVVADKLKKSNRIIGALRVVVVTAIGIFVTVAAVTSLFQQQQ